MLVLYKTFCVNFVWKVWCKYGFKRLWGYCLNIIFMPIYAANVGEKTCINLKQLYQERWMNAILDSGRKKYFCVKCECQGYPGNTRLLSSRPLWHLSVWLVTPGEYMIVVRPSWCMQSSAEEDSCMVYYFGQCKKSSGFYHLRWIGMPSFLHLE